MPRIVKEWACAAHGPFENASGRCPSGCSPRFVVQEIRSAPAIRSGATDRTDATVQSLADSYGMSDIANGGDGESVMTTLRKKPSFSPTWGHVDHAAPGWSQRGETAKTVSPGTYGAPAENRIAEVKPLLSGPTPIIRHQPFRPPAE
jgi:hypothetical protein